jgi:hypothetical protein
MANEELHQLHVSIEKHAKGQVIAVFKSERGRFEKARIILFKQKR